MSACVGAVALSAKRPLISRRTQCVGYNRSEVAEGVFWFTICLF